MGRRNTSKSSKPFRETRKKLKPKTKNQQEYIRAIVESDVTFCTGPAGSGKTAVAVGLACEYLLEKKVEKIIITRPVVESGGRGLGFLPGTMNEKLQPWLVPIMEEMNLYLTRDTVNSFRSSNRIELCPLEYMRGRNFHNSFMILDEAQNATYDQIKMFLTRIGRESKAIVNGDLDQTDLNKYEGAGLYACVEKLDQLDGVSICKLSFEDIIRNSIISKILTRLQE
ncbi:MAG TPA: hypothetical protein DCS66_22315 [Flavobacteriaceae bacterium]|nr:hypothetical protein [Flavobacteriaceae bacterium]